MPGREIISKIAAFAIAAAACIAGGVLALYGPHAYNDYFNAVLGLALIAIGLAVGGLGTLLLLGIVAELRREQKQHEVHIAPRDGKPGPPPAWGMGPIGRVDMADETVNNIHAAMSARVVGVNVRNWDAPLLIVGLLIWTAVFTIWLSPR